jgi:hypothetical protein
MNPNEARVELGELVHDNITDSLPVDPTKREIGAQVDTAIDAILAAGYRKAVTATEFGIIFNRAAMFLSPPAESLEEFKERYEQDYGWMLTERDTILTRTFLRCDPEPGEPVLHAGIAQ